MEIAAFIFLIPAFLAGAAVSDEDGPDRTDKTIDNLVRKLESLETRLEIAHQARRNRDSEYQDLLLVHKALADDFNKTVERLHRAREFMISL